jgi:hypothetical protein
MNRMRHCLKQGFRFEFQVMFNPLDIPVPDTAERHDESLSFRPIFALAIEPQIMHARFPHRCPAAAQIKAAFVSAMLRFEHFWRGIRPLSLGLGCFHLFPI